MSSSAVRTVIRTQLALALPAVTIVEVIGAFPAHPSQAAAWAAVEFLPGLETFAGMDGGAGRLWRESGTIQVHCFAPAGGGESSVLTNAEAVRSHFRGTRFSGVRVHGVDPPICGPGDQSGRWLRASVAFDYIYDVAD